MHCKSWKWSLTCLRLGTFSLKHRLVSCTCCSYLFSTTRPSLLQPFTTIFRDAEAQKDFTTGLYANSKFLTSLRKSLDKEGILVTQVGKTPYVNSPSEQFSTNRNRFDLINSLKDNGFGHIRSYEEVRLAKVVS